MCNRVIKTVIFPCTFSDHNLIGVVLSVSPIEHPKSYWKCNAKLLQDVSFCSKFVFFWEDWRGRKQQFESLKQWWENGKAQIKMFCQQYTALSTGRLKSAVGALEEKFLEIARKITGQNEFLLNQELTCMRRELGTLLQDRAGVLVQARHTHLKDVDAPTSFFFNLERRVGESKQMLCLHLRDGRISHDVGEMREAVVDFYEKLYGAEATDQQQADLLLEDLPTLGEVQRGEIGGRVSLQELTKAVQQMNSGRAPGVDGRPVNF